MIRLIPEPNRKHLWGQLLWFILWLAVTGIALYLKPSAFGHGTHTQLGFAPCPSVIFFDRPCPGCGLTTCFTNMVHLHFADAFRDHWIGPFMYLAFTASAWVCLYGYIRRLYFFTNSKTFNWSISVFAGIFLLYGFTRFALVKLHSPMYGMAQKIEKKAP